MRWMMVKERHLGHDGIHRDRARVIGDNQCAPLARHPIDPAHLHAKPALKQWSKWGQEQVLGEVSIKTEVIHHVVTRDPATHKVPEGAPWRRRRRRLMTVGIQGDDASISHGSRPG